MKNFIPKLISFGQNFSFNLLVGRIENVSLTFKFAVVFLKYEMKIVLFNFSKIMVLVLLVFLCLSVHYFVYARCINIPPVAEFSFYPLNPRVHETVVFNASLSYDSDGFIFSYFWDFGDGNRSVSSNPIIYHCFSSAGNFLVNLTVMDNLGSLNSTFEVVHIIAVAPYAFFTWSPERPEAGSPVFFDASNSTANDDRIISYAWDFGDGFSVVESNSCVVHVFQSFGKYEVTLNVTNSEGASSVAVKVIQVVEVPIANFSYSPVEPRVCTVITFNASISDSRGGYIIEYTWDFGDGSPVEYGVVVTHQFKSMGEFDVSLNVTDSEGEWNVKTMKLKVLPHIADLNEDGKVNIQDLNIFARSFGSYPGNVRWDPKADINDDERVNIQDGVIIARAFAGCIHLSDPDP